MVILLDTIAKITMVENSPDIILTNDISLGKKERENFNKRPCFSIGTF